MRYALANWKLFLFLLLFQPWIAFASNLDNAINQTLTSFGENLNIGILVQDVKTGETLYAKAADRYFMPASNQKLFTAYSAFHLLGNDFSYQTRLYVDRTKIINGALNDNVYIQFSGDPALTLVQLDHMIGELVKYGVNKITGFIIVDDTIFDNTSMSPGTTWEDGHFCYGAPVNGIILDHNCVTATLIPAKKMNHPAILLLPSPPQFIRLTNHVTTEASSSECSLDLDMSDENNYILSGCVKLTDNPRKLMMAIKNPRNYLQAALVFLLNRNNIISNQQFIFQKITHPPAQLTQITSASLPLLITKMLKESDNLIANSLFKAMGARTIHEQGNWKNSAKAVRDFIGKTLNMPIAKTTFIDGAGNSRYDYVTAQQIVALLRSSYNSAFGSYFITALPVSGTDGTLQDRMKMAGMKSRVRAKTGSEMGASALSGYIQTNNNRLLAFSILINGFVDSPAKYRALEDSICTVIAQNA